MSKSSGSVGGSGVGIFGLLGVAFVVLKLCDVISWSWWLVLLPFYGPAALVLAAILLLFACVVPCAVIATLVEQNKKGRGR